MRVLLIATNQHNRLMGRMNAQPMPIGLAYVAGHLDRQRHSVRILDLMFSDDFRVEVRGAVEEFQPDLVGISLRNLSNHSYTDPQWALPVTKEVIDLIRSSSRATIVCGGPAFSILPIPCFRYLGPDLGIAGDASEVFASLADKLDIGEPSYSDLPGMVFRRDDQIIYSGAPCVSSFSKPPNLEGLDMARYNQAGFGIGILTKLGGFYYPTLKSPGEAEATAWRVIRPIKEVVAEVKQMKERYGVRKVFFIDNAFNTPLEHAKALCRALLDADLKVHWNTCLAPYGCDSNLVALMGRAGCALVVMGGLRGDPQDGTSLIDQLEPLRETCRRCEGGGLHYTISTTFGEPGDTRQTVDEKLSFLRSVRPAIANLRVGISVLPGSAVAQRALDEGLIRSEDDLIRPTFYLAPAVKDWIVDYLKGQAGQNPRWNLV